MNAESVKQAYPELTDVETDRVVACLDLARQVIGSEPTDFVIANELAGEETRWTSLWLGLESGGVMEFFSFVRGGKFDYVPAAGLGLRHAQWEFEDYDFKNATDASRIKISISIGQGGLLSGLSMGLTGVGRNCDRILGWAARRAALPVQAG